LKDAFGFDASLEEEGLVLKSFGVRKGRAFPGVEADSITKLR
jgi:hypothetical protein